MLAIISAGAAELYNAGVRAGIDPQRVWEVLTRLAPILEARRAGFTEGRYETAMFAVADIVKDLRLATGLYHDLGIDAPVTQTARELFQRITPEHNEQDIAAITALWRAPVGAPPSSWR
jgi:3-hydroxyisobutyrate dehydrogenase-like beta-hydroxyacid dehydrogenase